MSQTSRKCRIANLWDIKSKYRIATQRFDSSINLSTTTFWNSLYHLPLLWCLQFSLLSELSLTWVVNWNITSKHPLCKAILHHLQPKQIINSSDLYIFSYLSRLSIAVCPFLSTCFMASKVTLQHTRAMLTACVGFRNSFSLYIIYLSTSNIFWKTLYELNVS